MKKLKVILLLSLFANPVFSQFKIDEIPAKRFSLGAYGNLFGEGLIVGIEGGIQLPKHWLNIALATDPFDSYSKYYQNGALNLNYNFFPNGYSNRFDLFFDFNYILDINRYSFKHYIDENLNKTYFIISNNLNLGFGFNTNFTQHFFIKSGFGIGANFTSNGNYSYVDLSGNIRLILGYRF
jgi:hypothetical protein